VHAGRISALCWLVFAAMCGAVYPLVNAVVTALPGAPGDVLLALIIGCWWVPFGYALYLGQAVMRNGDRRLLRRGIAGTARVLAGQQTSLTISAGEHWWQAPQVYRYDLLVSVPGRAEFETRCLLCASGISPGSTVPVAVSPRNHRRVMIDVGQAEPSQPEPSQPEPSQPALARPEFARPEFARPEFAQPEFAQPGLAQPGFRSPELAEPELAAPELAEREFAPAGPASARLEALSRLGRLHREGVLTDDEFAVEKARILAG
jgi:hypothetical protein